MGIESQESTDFEWLTWRRVRVLRHLAAFRSESEIAELENVSYNTVRSAVEAIKNRTGLHTVRDMGRWWLEAGPEWLSWAAKQGGLDMNPDGSQRKRDGS